MHQRALSGASSSCSAHTHVLRARVRSRAVNPTSPEVATAASRKTTSFHRGIQYTSLECNTFAVKFSSTGVRVLVDPWLVGDLTFPFTDWLIRGKKRCLDPSRGTTLDVTSIMAETDVVVITQALDDHCHMPTLQALPKSGFTIVCNPETAAKIKPLGFADVRVIDHGQSLDLMGKLRVTACVGSLVGPPWSKRQLGVLLRELPCPSTDGLPGTSLFYEPHCDFDPRSVERSTGGQPVDVVVSPVKSQLLGVPPATYPIVLGDINLMQLLKVLKPKVLVPLMNAEIDQQGPLAEYITERGPSFEELRGAIRREGLATKLEVPAPPGEALAVAL